ncbi:MAG TPA: NYN domain-containing protein [Candidatus Acidoferrales bacterium]|nr:NYN domain-containing protein [Candidatus Acidoferrales bacterium]
MADVALLIDWENVYYTLRQHTTGPLPSTLAILQAILQKAAEFGPVRVKQAIFGSEVAAQDDTLLMALEFTGIEPVAVAQRMSGRLLKGRSDAVLITRAAKLLYKERPDIEVWFIVSGDRDLNALCKALKDEDKKVYLVAGDLSLANELRDSPYLRDGVFLLEELIPQARWTRGGLRQDDTQYGKDEAPRRTDDSAAPAPVLRTTMSTRGRRGGRGRGGKPPVVPAVVPTGTPESEKEQRRLAVLLLDQLVAIRADAMPRADFVQSVVPLSEKEASQVLEQRIDAGIEQQHVVARNQGRFRATAKQLIAPNMSSALVAETLFHLVRLLRRIDTVTKDTKRVPVVEAVLDPLSRADQPGGLARGRSQRRILLDTLYNIAEERGAIASEAVQRDGKEITMCWLSDEHPLVQYARQPSAGIVHLFNFVSTTRGHGDRIDWVQQALFAELLSRVEGDALESSMKAAVDRGIMRPETHGNKPGYALDRAQPEIQMLLGEFHRLELNGNGADHQVETPDATADMPPQAVIVDVTPPPDAAAPGAGGPAAPRKRTRRGSRGGRNRRGGRGRKKTTSSPGGEAAD